MPTRCPPGRGQACPATDARHAARSGFLRPGAGATSLPGSHRPNVASSISSTRQRQILALLLGALSVLALASVATYQAPLPFAQPWTAPNACGPVGATLAFALV